MKKKTLKTTTLLLLTSFISSCGPSTSLTPGSLTSPIPPTSLIPGSSTSPTSPTPSTPVTPPPSSVIPDGTVCENNDGDLLSSITKEGVSFVGKVIIAGKRGNDFYVEDQSGFAFVFLNTETKYNVLQVGDRVEIKATVKSFAGAGIMQLDTVTAMTKLSSDCSLREPAVVTKLSEIDAYRMGRVTLTNATIKSKAIVAGNVDSKIIVGGADGADITLFISKRVAEKSAIEDVFASLIVGSKVNIVRAFADYYKGAQIALTAVSQIEPGNMSYEDKIKSIETSAISPLNNSSTRKNITLPTSSLFGSTISWSSSNPEFLTSSGAVTRPTDTDKIVTLTYEITLDGVKAQAKSISVTVLKFVEGENDYEYTYVEPYYSGNYYNNIDSSARDKSLLLSLDDLLDSTEARHSDFSYKNLWNVFAKTDSQVVGGETKYYAFYTGKLTSRGEMNKEHVWPNSRGGNFVENDPHMIRPTLTADNSGRGNDFFNASPTKYDPASLGNPIYRGISARIVFYAAVKAQENGLKIVDLTNDSTGNKSMGKLSDLLKWNLEYDIDQTEIQRNEVLVRDYKHSRNPFIDDRNYACKVWGQTNAATKQVCGYK